jgi:hypothetical protein
MPRVTSSQLQVNQEFQGAAPDATLVVTMDQGRPLVVGTYVFQLIVRDNSDNPSQPTTFRLVVVDEEAPTAIINGPERVRFNAEFTLSGAQSADVGGGSIVRYTWTLLSAPGRISPIPDLPIPGPRPPTGPVIG